MYCPRLTKPEKGNKFYNTKSNGGYSTAILGKYKATGKCDSECNVLPNCVGYAFGRFHEIMNDTKMNKVSPINAENFPEYTKCKTGQIPKRGAIIVWQKGKANNENDGAGHVAIVEEIISDTEITISQSGYKSSKAFWTETCSKLNNTWKCSWMDSSYTFRCFIYNPVVLDTDLSILSEGTKGLEVKALQKMLNNFGNYNLKIDGIFGDATTKALKDFQKKNKLTINGMTDNSTYELLKLYAELSSDMSVIKVDGKSIKVKLTKVNNENYIRITDLINFEIIKSVEYTKL